MLRMLNRGPISEGMRGKNETVQQFFLRDEKKFFYTPLLNYTILDNPTSDDPEEKELYVSSVSSQ